jgi:hypothetical protein
MSYRRNLLWLRGALLATLFATSTLLASSAGLIAAGSAQASTLPTLTLTINASSITVGGPLESGAVNVVSTATGIKEPAAILFLVKPGVSVAEVYAFLENKKASGNPNGATKYGSIVFDTEPGAGQKNEAQTTLQPGQYIALAGPGEGNVTKLRSSFTVTAAKAPAALPAPQATVRSIEFGFRGPSVLHDGELVRFENEGFLVHMDVAAPAKSQQAAKQLAKDLLTGHEKQAFKLISGQPVTFAGPLSSGAFQQETITAKPGWYVQVCFMDTQDGRSHSLLGMERVIKITK